jgi:hypothetical protein
MFMLMDPDWLGSWPEPFYGEGGKRAVRRESHADQDTSNVDDVMRYGTKRRIRGQSCAKC